MNSNSYELGDLCGKPTVSYGKHYARYEELSLDSRYEFLSDTERNGTAHGIEVESQESLLGKLKATGVKRIRK
jgi:hypothetical protein